MNIKKFKMFESESKIDIYIEDILEVLNNKYDDMSFEIINDTMYADVVCKNIRVRTKYKVSSEDFVETISKVDNIIRKSNIK